MRTILCVDDSTYAAGTLKEFLQRHGYSVSFVSDGPAAIDLVKGEDITAVLLDCHIPDAEEVAIAIRHARRNVPIVMLSAYCRVPCDRLQHADSCLQKGYSAAALLDTIETLTSERYYGLCRFVPYRVA